VIGFLIVSTIAVVEYFQLRSARERIEELEARGGGTGDGGGGPFGDLGDFIEDLLGDTEGLFEGVGDIGAQLECLGAGITGGGTGEAGTSVEEIAAQVEGLRELEFTGDVEPEFVSNEEMTSRVRELFLEDYTPEIADIEERLLTGLGAIPRGTDLRELRAGAIGQQVAGYYEPETGELVVRQAGAELSAIDRITLSHELDHALTDQALDIPLPDDPEVGTEDASLAALALVEGDATFVMQRYSATLGVDEQLELLDPAVIAEAEAGLSNFPPYLEQELIFPYEEGLSFVCDLYANGGWAAVNEAYDKPPVSTAQVMFPDRFRAGESPHDPSSPGNDPPKGWRVGPRVQLGAANLLWLFEAPGGDRSRALSDPRSAAGEWAGGVVEMWTRGPDTALDVTLVDRPEGGSLCESVSKWYSQIDVSDQETTDPQAALVSEGADQDALMTCEGDRVRLGIGPSLEVARAAAA
jgi:hypothetical protein